MLKIRLRRGGSKRQPSYRIVVAESTASRDGKFIEVIGFYNPRTQPETIRVKEERALHWLSVGAQLTDSAAQLFKKHGTTDRFARLKSGEPVETLVAEAEAAVQVINPQTKPAIREKTTPAAKPATATVEPVVAAEDSEADA